jgi:hypothetical protein
MLFQEHDLVAALCQVKRRRGARDAAAHNANVALDASLQRRMGVLGMRRSGVIRGKGGCEHVRRAFMSRECLGYFYADAGTVAAG